VGTLMKDEAEERRLISMMFGTTPPAVHRDDITIRQEAAPVLELKSVTTPNGAGELHLDGVSLAVRPYEIVGIAGISGSGQKQIGDVILGLLPYQGEKRFAAQDASHWPVSRLRRNGLSIIPENPLGGVVGSMTVTENMALADRARYAGRLGLSMNWAAVQRETMMYQQKCQIPMPNAAVAAETLSGGNLQRLIIVRELGQQHKLVVAFYPTQALDLPTAVATRQLLVQARDGGAGVLLISEDLDELFTLSDTILVLCGGRIVGRFRPKETTREAVGHLMTVSVA